MNLLSDIITYVRRIIKSPTNAVITDNLIIDYINRFWIMDMSARIQTFDLKTKYQFETSPGFDRYNAPLYSVQVQGSNNIYYYPVYQGFMGPVYINGVQVPFYTESTNFFNLWPKITQQMNVVAVGDGGKSYSFTFPISPKNTSPVTTPFQYILRGHVDMTGVIANANYYSALQDPPIVTTLNTSIPSANTFPAVYITSNGLDGFSIVVSDSGQFLSGNMNYGLLTYNSEYPLGLNKLNGGYSVTENTINYFTGEVNVTFPVAIPAGVSINAQCYLFQCGLPRGVLFYNNVLTFRSPPDRQYLVEVDAYLSPAAFLSSNQAIQFAHMSEYIARGAARKILSDTKDDEQFAFYEPLFIEQENLVWKRSQRQFTSTRTQTIYSQGSNQGQSFYGSIGGSTQ
jgi:hypothetical protein